MLMAESMDTKTANVDGSETIGNHLPTTVDVESMNNNESTLPILLNETE